MIGQTVSHYEILDKLGEGGMGVVYRARDTKLDRDVALKFLPAHLAASESDKARFIQEAKAAATLNHPNICTVHDIGEVPTADGKGPQLFIVMEYVQGQSLQEKKHSLTLKQATDIGIQVAEGLSAAHEKGIVHRDIKPENIMIRKDGIAQIMDFGLAKLQASRSTRLTKQGSTVGTAGYMSPEQVQGQDTDHRSDIFSLGVLLYEMFAGKMPFQGVHETAILYEVVNVDPAPPTSLKPELEPELDRIILECLQKEPDERYNSVKDVAKDLKRFRRESSRQRTSRVTQVDRSAIRSRVSHQVQTENLAEEKKTGLLWPVLAVVAFLGAVVFGYLWLSSSGEGNRDVTRFRFSLAGTGVLARGTMSMDISPDGREIALITVGGDRRRQDIVVRRLDALGETEIPGTDGSRDISYSPDGAWLAFSSQGRVKKIPVRGGPVVELAPVQATRGLDWGDANRIVYTPSPADPLFMVSSEGGEPEQVTVLDTAAGDVSHRQPELLPGGDAILYTVKTKFISAFSEAKIAVQRIGSPEKRILIDGGTGARYLASGHILYARGPSLFVVPFDLSSLETTGDSRLVFDSTGMLDEAFGSFVGRASTTGTLVYAAGGPLPTGTNDLTVFDRMGKVVPFMDIKAPFGPFSISPDRKRVAAQNYAANDDIWVYDVDRGIQTRLTFAGGNNWYPLWTPDGQNIVYTSERAGFPNLFMRAVDGSGTERRIAQAPSRQIASSISPDAGILSFTQDNADGNTDIWTVSLAEGGEARPFIATRFNESEGKISPDSRWMVYQSDESGNSEVYVRPFPEGSGKWQISVGGGTTPFWTKGGREILYLSPDMGVNVVPVDVSGGFTPGRSTRLYTLPNPPIEMDVSPDGERIAITSYGARVDISELIVVVNWFEELRRGEMSQNR